MTQGTGSPAGRVSGSCSHAQSTESGPRHYQTVILSHSGICYAQQLPWGGTRTYIHNLLSMLKMKKKLEEKMPHPPLSAPLR